MDLSDKLQSLVNSSGFAPLAFVFAFLAGAAHAVGPGHGKTLAAAYLVGNKGKLRDAVWLSGSVALMHTISVLVIAIGWTFYSLSDLVHLTTLTTILQLVAGLLTLATGGWLLHRHLSGRTSHALHSHGGIWHSHGDLEHSPDGPDNAHSHGGHDHGHSHSHHHEHEHVNTAVETAKSGGPHHDNAAVPAETPPSRRPGVMILGAAGGLVPSPTAFLVLTTGFFSGHAAFALLLVITFGIGMAAVLLGVGLLALGGSSLISRGARSRSVLRLATRIAPAVAAVAITGVGVVITVISVADLVP